MCWTLLSWLHPLRKGATIPSPGPKDRVALRLPGLDIAVERTSTLEVPAELTIVVPRAELRARMSSPQNGEASVEVILNSITIAHSPRHVPEQRVSRESRSAGT